jgi:exonuclease SbcD
MGMRLFYFSNQVETYQAITKSGETIYIHGFSYQNDASYENKIDAYPSSQGQKNTDTLLGH